MLSEKNELVAVDCWTLKANVRGKKVATMKAIKLCLFIVLSSRALNETERGENPLSEVGTSSAQVGSRKKKRKRTNVITSSCEGQTVRPSFGLMHSRVSHSRERQEKNENDPLVLLYLPVSKVPVNL